MNAPTRNVNNQALHNKKKLLLRVAYGDEMACRQVYDHYCKKKFAFALYLAESEIQADEIIQEVFIKVRVLYPYAIATVKPARRPKPIHMAKIRKGFQRPYQGPVSFPAGAVWIKSVY